MSKSNEYIEGRIKWRAEQNKLPSDNAFHFDTLNCKLKLKFENLFKGIDLGIPILLFLGEENTWTIVGTRKAISGTFKNFEQISYSEITKHTVGDDPFHEFYAPEEDEYDVEEFHKMAQHQILLRNKNNEVITLNTSQGSDLYALYNILIMMIRLASDNCS